jgi:hypothetical protein
LIEFDLSDAAHHDPKAFDRDYFDWGSRFDQPAFADHIDAAPVDHGGAGRAKDGLGNAGLIDEFGPFDSGILNGSVGDKKFCHPAVGQEAEPENCSDGQENADRKEHPTPGAETEAGESQRNSSDQADQSERPGDEAGQHSFQKEKDRADGKQRDNGFHVMKIGKANPGGKRNRRNDRF